MITIYIDLQGLMFFIIQVPMKTWNKTVRLKKSALLNLKMASHIFLRYTNKYFWIIDGLGTHQRIKKTTPLNINYKASVNLKTIAVSRKVIQLLEMKLKTVLRYVA